MRAYWYVSLNNQYPLSMKEQRKRVVMSVQMKEHSSIIEMTREATPNEIDQCKLVYCGHGHGHWNDEHIKKNISRYI